MTRSCGSAWADRWTRRSCRWTRTRRLVCAGATRRTRRATSEMSPPRYVTNSGNRFLINWTHARSADNTANIDIETGQTINVSTVGANGILQSGTLGGTVSASGNVVTSADTDLSSLFMVGDVLFVESLSQARRVIGITSSSQMEVESAFGGSVSGATFRRGGLAPNTHYYLYVAATYYFMSTRCQYLGDPLLDFTGTYAQTPYVVTTDSNANVYQAMYTAERVHGAVRADVLHRNQLPVLRRQHVGAWDGDFGAAPRERKKYLLGSVRPATALHHE